MKKFVCPVCGYVHEGDSAPEKCPHCGVPGSKFKVMEDGALNFVCEHVIGVGAKDKIDPEIYSGLKSNFEAECCEVGMYIAMSRQAIREGYPEIGAFLHAGRFGRGRSCRKICRTFRRSCSSLHKDKFKNACRG